MNPLPWLSRPECAALAAALLHFLWQGTLIALLLAAVFRLAKIQRPAQRYACSLAALLAMAACPPITFFIAARQADPTALSAAETTNAAEVAAVRGDDSLAADPWLRAQTLARESQPYLLALWLAGVCVLSLWLLCGVLGAVRLSRRRLPLPLPLAGRVEQLGRALKIDALPRVFLSRQVREALVIGIWRPVVLVPAAWATEMPLVALEAIIAHELAHIRRWDLWVNLLQRVVETLLFYHPAVWWVSRQLRQVREMCCDELAVRATGLPVEYAETLELVARERLAGVRPALAAGIRGETNMNLLARVKHVLGGPAGDGWTLWPAGLLALLLPLGLWGATLTVVGLSPAAVVANDDADENDDREVDRGENRKEDAGKDDDDRERDESARKKKESLREEREEREDDERRTEASPKKERPVGKISKKIRQEGDEGGLPAIKKRRLGLEEESPAKKKLPTAKKSDSDEAANVMAMLKELRVEVDRLRAEVRELRAGQVAGPEEATKSRKDLSRLKAEAFDLERAELLHRLKAHPKGRDSETLKEQKAIQLKVLAAIGAKEDAIERERAELREHAAKEQLAKEQAHVAEKLRLAVEEKARAADREAAERKEQIAKEQAAIEEKLRLAVEEKARAADREAAERKEQIAKEQAAIEEKLRRLIEEQERALKREAAEELRERKQRDPGEKQESDEGGRRVK